MGLLSMPWSGLLRVFEEVAAKAEDELYSVDNVKAELIALHRRFEAGGMSEEEFDRLEVEILQRLKANEAHQRSHARARRSA